MKRNKKERIAVISDGTGDTAENFVRAILSQFDRTEAELVRVPKLKTKDLVLAALDKFEPPYLIVYTFAKVELRKLVWTETKRRGLIGLDILYPAVEVFSQFFQLVPTEQQAVLHSTQSFNYFDRMEAIEYTVKHDDGQKLNDLDHADIILTGVSRTSKTPTSMYLAHKGYKVANVPLVFGIEAPPTLMEAHAKGVKVIMLTIEAPTLEKIRRSRFQRLGTSTAQSDTYVQIDRIREETIAALALARRYKWPVIDVTSKAIEETASEILILVSPKEEKL